MIRELMFRRSSHRKSLPFGSNDRHQTLRTQDLEENEMSSASSPIPPDDPKRSLTVAQPDNLPHIGLVGDTYTITVTGEQTAGRFCVILHVNIMLNPHAATQV